MKLYVIALKITIHWKGSKGDKLRFRFDKRKNIKKYRSCAGQVIGDCLPRKIFKNRIHRAGAAAQLQELPVQGPGLIPGAGGGGANGIQSFILNGFDTDQCGSNRRSQYTSEAPPLSLASPTACIPRHQGTAGVSELVGSHGSGMWGYFAPGMEKNDCHALSDQLSSSWE